MNELQSTYSDLPTSWYDSSWVDYGPNSLVRCMLMWTVEVGTPYMYLTK